MTQTHAMPRTLRRRSLLGLLVPAGLAACAPGRDLPVFESARPDAYRLDVDDQIRIVTYGQEQLSDDFRIADDGTVAVPLLGTVQAQGLSTSQLGARIAAGLRDKKLLRDPSVSVEITAYRPIFVLGEVAKPGQYPYQPGMTMLTAVTIAGGFTYRGVQRYAYVVRQSGRTTIEGRVLPGGFLKPGDVMKVYERVF